MLQIISQLYQLNTKRLFNFLSFESKYKIAL